MHSSFRTDDAAPLDAGEVGFVRRHRRWLIALAVIAAAAIGFFVLRGGKPDENAPPNSNSIGFASGAAIGLGPVSIGRGWNYGATQSCTRNWNGYSGNDPEYSAGRSSGGFPVRVGGFNLEAEARIAFQLTHNF